MKNYNTIKSVLISQTAIPSSKIGSWNIMITNLINTNAKVFDYIISPKPDYKAKTIDSYTIPNLPSFKDKVLFRITKNKYILKKRYWNPLKEILHKEGKLVVNIIDDFGILNCIHYYARKNNLRNKIFINFYFHGYFFDVNLTKVEGAFSIDKLILLTKISYNKLVENSLELPFEVNILPNGIMPTFKLISKIEKEKLREKYNFDKTKKYFLWLSQDRPKKGLKIILRAWKEVLKQRNDVQLLVIGTETDNIENKQENVQYLGRIPNNQLPSYYQLADYYLFPTLWHEGHPLSLTEALKCGLKCIASDINPVNEVLQNGDLGYLVKEPNMVKSWIQAIDFVLNNDYDFNKKNINLNDIYNFDNWKDSFIQVVNQSKQSFY